MRITVDLVTGETNATDTDEAAREDAVTKIVEYLTELAVPAGQREIRDALNLRRESAYRLSSAGSSAKKSSAPRRAIAEIGFGISVPVWIYIGREQKRKIAKTPMKQRTNTVPRIAGTQRDSYFFRTSREQNPGEGYERTEPEQHLHHLRPYRPRPWYWAAGLLAQVAFVHGVDRSSSERKDD